MKITTFALRELEDIPDEDWFRDNPTRKFRVRCPTIDELRYAPCIYTRDYIGILGSGTDKVAVAVISKDGNSRIGNMHLGDFHTVDTWDSESANAFLKQYF